MPDWLRFERELYWAFFSAAFLAIGLWETYRPVRPLIASNTKRWAVHIVMAALSNTMALLMPVSATAVAIAAQSHSFGLLNGPALPLFVKCCVAIVLLDFAGWAQHFLYHRISFLWRIHRVHHADPDYDVTTSLRFHPIEAFFTQGTYLLVIFVIAPLPLVVLAFEMTRVVQNFLSHANTTYTARLDRLLRYVVVTPDMHRIHHSQEIGEQNRNFGTLLPWWDRLFGTYADSPEAGYEQMQVGLKEYQGARCLNVVEMLAMPFRRTIAGETAQLNGQDSILSGNGQSAPDRHRGNRLRR